MAERPGEFTDSYFGTDDLDFSSFLHGMSEDTNNGGTDITTEPNRIQPTNTLPPPVPFNPNDFTLDDFSAFPELDQTFPTFADPFLYDTTSSHFLEVAGTNLTPQTTYQTPTSYYNPTLTNNINPALPSPNFPTPQAELFKLPSISYYTVADIPPESPVRPAFHRHEIANIAPVEPSYVRASPAPALTIPQRATQWQINHPSVIPSKRGPSPLPLQIPRAQSTSESPETSPEVRPSKLVGSVNLTKYYGEKPKASSEQPWGRINASTKGLTSRTGKINHYNPEEVYERIPHPLNGEWATRGRKVFEYNKWGELQRSSFGFNMLKEFILQHPKTEDCKLTLYIQRSPADSMRRYPTKNGSLCRFDECPMREFGLHGNIIHGHYRVALDELSYKYGAKERNDPMIVSGYVHLYCLERFMDLPALCQLPHIRVVADARTLSREPNGKFQAALSGNDYKVACNFIEVCKRGALRQHPDFNNYPEHQEYRDAGNKRQVRPKHHNMTLNYMMQKSRNEERCLRVRNNSSPSTIAVHLGDLDIYCKARKGIIMSLADIPAPTNIDSTEPKTSKTVKKTPAKAVEIVARTRATAATKALVDYSDSDEEGNLDDKPLFTSSRKRSRGSASSSGSKKRRKS
jgi:hypothetical protein